MELVVLLKLPSRRAQSGLVCAHFEGLSWCCRTGLNCQPCNLDSRDSDKSGVAVTGGCSLGPRSLKTVGERRAPPVDPLNPNSRRGRKARSSFRQGRVGMDRSIVGIDVSKDRLNVVVRPSGETLGRDFALGMQALKRLAQPDDIGGVVAFLASEDARWNAGDTIHVDGSSKL